MKIKGYPYKVTCDSCGEEIGFLVANSYYLNSIITNTKKHFVGSNHKEAYDGPKMPLECEKCTKIFGFLIAEGGLQGRSYIWSFRNSQTRMFCKEHPPKSWLDKAFEDASKPTQEDALQ